MSRGRHEGGDQRRLHRSSVLAGVSDGVAAPALALLAGGLTRDPLAVAAVVAAQHAPWAVVAVAGGRVWPHAGGAPAFGLLLAGLAAAAALGALAAPTVGQIRGVSGRIHPLVALAAPAFGYRRGRLARTPELEPER